MIDFENVTITYPDATEPALRNVDLHIPEGELCLVVGLTGVGKSTLLGAMNGLVPHFTGGTVSGRITVDGRSTSDHRPRDLAGIVGSVVQDPIRGFVADVVEDELAYGMEQLAVPAQTMRKRVEETLDLLGISELRRRPMRTLSGGQQQRVAIGSVLTSHPSILVLDEPTSALDPAAAEDVLAALTRLVHDLGMTVVLAEHRLERVVEYADMIVSVDREGRVRSGAPADVLRDTDVAPPVVRLAQAVGWDPLPLSVRDARRCARDLRPLLADATPRRVRGAAARSIGVDGNTAGAAIDVRRLVVRYPGTVAVAGVDLRVDRGEVVALMGRNGSGKTSLLWAVHGAGRRSSGTIELAGGVDPAEASADTRQAAIGLVPQTPSDLLYLSTVADECAAADASRPTRLQPGDADADRTCRSILDRLVPDVLPATHPRDLSEGQRLALALAIQLTADPQVVLLDEPTRGLDEHAKARLGGIIHDLSARGRAVVIATHDVEFTASVASRVVVLAEGEIVADGPTSDIVRSSPVYAPQVAKVMQPGDLLTVDEVVAAIDSTVSR